MPIFLLIPFHFVYTYPCTGFVGFIWEGHQHSIGSMTLFNVDLVCMGRPVRGVAVSI